MYTLSLYLDVDYQDLRERDYPLLAPNALAERLRKINELFPANPGFEFAVYHRQKAAVGSDRFRSRFRFSPPLFARNFSVSSVVNGSVPIQHHRPNSPAASYTIEPRPMNRMILANLVHRPFRTIISVVAVAVEVTLILLIVGIMLGMLNDSKNRQAGIGADIMVQPPGSSLLMGVSGAPVSVKVADKLAQAAARGCRGPRRHPTHHGGNRGSPRRH